MRKILVLAIRAIGDMVLVTPAIRALAEAFPDSGISVVAEAFAADVFDGNPRISEVIPFDRWSLRGLPWYRKVSTDLAWLRRIRDGRYDAVVDLFCGPRSAQMAFFSGAPVRVAEAVRGRRFLYTHAVAVEHEGKHLVEQKMQIVGALTGEVPIRDVEVFLHEREREEAQSRLRHESGGFDGPFVGFFPGAGWDHREWPADKFARLGDMLAVRGFHAVVLGGPRDVDACRRVADLMSSRPVVLGGIARLRETISLIDRMSLFVSNDTGPMHIAAGLGRPTIGLFGPGDIVKYRPWGAHAHVISARLPCSPCPQWRDTCHLRGFRRKECMERISVEEVYTKAVEILDAIPRATKAAGEDQ